MKKVLIYFLSFAVGAYLFLLVVVFFAQEKLIFHPQKLSSNHQFSFSYPFEEMNFTTPDDIKLHGMLFRQTQKVTTKRLIFYLHGNAGSLEHWGEIAPVYTNLGYDIFILDYRGFGKSEGSLKNEKQFFEDAQLVYDELKKQYSENEITIIGYSVGTGTATWLASQNQPKQLILKAPYYSLKDLAKRNFPIVPSFLLKYPFETYKYLPKVKVPITLFHGDQDEVIYYGSSQRLSKHIKETDQFITLKNHSHTGLNHSPVFQMKLMKILQAQP